MCVSQVGDNLRKAQRKGQKIVGRGRGRPSPLRILKPKTAPKTSSTGTVKQRITNAIRPKTKDINYRL